MTNLTLYHEVSEKTSQLITKKYSSSFSRSVLLLSPEIRNHIYNIYGFVRLADEIVDTFHDYNKSYLLKKFIAEYRESSLAGISINPVIHSFCYTKDKFNIPDHLVESFLNSMSMDLGDMNSLNTETYEQYIYGSAEAVGLMCLKIFVNGNAEKYEQLKFSAKSLGAALQKVNFLRDIESDYNLLNRTYFPNVDFKKFSQSEKMKIEIEIDKDFKNALEGIKQLPLSSRYAVYLAYRYYYGLFSKIQESQSSTIFEKRIRLNSIEKMILFSKIMIYKNFKLHSYLS